MIQNDGKKAEALLDQIGMSPAQYAEKHGCSTGSVYNWLRQSVLPGEFVLNLCEDAGISRSDFYNDGETSVHPAVAGIVEELNFAAENYSRTWQTIIFGGVLAMLKKHRQLFESGEWK